MSRLGLTDRPYQGGRSRTPSVERCLEGAGMTEADGSDSLVAPACYSGLTLKLVRGDGLENACPEGCKV